MPKTIMTWGDTPPAGKRVDQTDFNNTNAREAFATGTNTQKEDRPSHKPFGKLGARPGRK